MIKINVNGVRIDEDINEKLEAFLKNRGFTTKTSAIKFIIYDFFRDKKKE